MVAGFINSFSVVNEIHPPLVLIKVAIPSNQAALWQIGSNTPVTSFP